MSIVAVSAFVAYASMIFEPASSLVEKSRSSVRKLIENDSRRYTVLERLAQYEAEVARRLAPHFAVAGASYPPKRLVLVGIKEDRGLELWVGEEEGQLVFIRSYPILAASGALGPKLREGDLQVPEGIYGVGYLNPNSRYHLSFEVDYPNAFDERMAERTGRKDLGGSIMIHGSRFSAGCLAMGDRAATELFVLVAKVGRSNVRIILTPVDFRRREVDEAELSALRERIPWTDELYGEIRAALEVL